MSAKMALRRFTLRAAGGFRSRDGGERFGRELIDSCGTNVPALDGTEAPIFPHSFGLVDHGKKSRRIDSAFWPACRVLPHKLQRDRSLLNFPNARMRRSPSQQLGQGQR